MANPNEQQHKRSGFLSTKAFVIICVIIGLLSFQRSNPTMKDIKENLTSGQGAIVQQAVEAGTSSTDTKGTTDTDAATTTTTTTTRQTEETKESDKQDAPSTPNKDDKDSTTSRNTKEDDKDKKPTKPPPNILFVMIDDIGWGDVGFHLPADEDLETEEDKELFARLDRREVQTPNMDQLVKEGLELNRHYVHLTCEGTRTALQSGRFPVHIQQSLANPNDPSAGMPRNLTGFAQHLKKNDLYATHYVGKWDAGNASPKHTPNGRGYDTSLGYFGHKVRIEYSRMIVAAACEELNTVE